MSSAFYLRSHFKEADVVVQSIGRLIGHSEDQCMIHNNLIVILKQYQEQPALLDSHLEVIVHSLLNLLGEYLPRLRRLRLSNTESQLVCTPADEQMIKDIWYISSIMYTICIVRRPKATVKVFPTEVHLVEPVLDAIEDLIELQNGHGMNYNAILTAVPGKPPPKCLSEFFDPNPCKILIISSAILFFC